MKTELTKEQLQEVNLTCYTSFHGKEVAGQLDDYYDPYFKSDLPDTDSDTAIGYVTAEGKVWYRIRHKYPIPNDFDYNNTHEISINGVISIPTAITADEFMDLFLQWVEANNMAFGGGIGPYTETE